MDEDGRDPSFPLDSIGYITGRRSRRYGLYPPEIISTDGSVGKYFLLLSVIIYFVFSTSSSFCLETAQVYLLHVEP